ncbi:MAG: SAM-dependent methyltransferase, partial [Myxococcota bacterium]
MGSFTPMHGPRGKMGANPFDGVDFVVLPTESPPMAWAFLTRARGERDLTDELETRLKPGVARQLADGVVRVDERPRQRDGTLAGLTFARQAMRVFSDVPAETVMVAGMLADALATHRPRSGGQGWTWALQIVAPDSSDPKDPRKAVARRLTDELDNALEGRLPPELSACRVDAEQAQRLAQVWVLTPDTALIGLTVAQQALSRWPAGRMRLRRAEDDPSRAALKLEEAIDWIGMGPEGGDLCVDLGAAPGGWTQVAMRRGAAVIAVDPGTMKITGPKRKYTHLK